MARAALPTVLPLLAWPEQAEIDRLEGRRLELQRRVGLARPHSHRRVELEMQLKLVTAEQLRLQIQLRRSRH